ncbi:MAG TPA: hypothetical protein VM009_04480 [Terriglobales bacterium]|nr:hypothetical protein [Terriglobales bacterium]
MSSSPMHLTGPQDPNAKPEREGMAIVPILMAIGVATLVAITAFQVLGKHPVGTAFIDRVNAVEMPGGDRVVVEMELSMTNTTDKPLKYHSAEIKLTANQEFKDEPAASPEVPRIYQSYPALKQSNEPPLKQSTILEPGATLRGVVIVAFPVSKATFDARKQIEAAIYFFEKPPIHAKK